MIAIHKCLCYRLGSVAAIIAVVFSLAGCNYQAKLLEKSRFRPGATVVVRCKMNARPIVRISENGDFIFWATGPGPIAAGTAHLINIGNNEKHWKALQPVLNKDYYTYRFEKALKDALVANGLIIKEMQINKIKLLKLPEANLQDMVSGSVKQRRDYILELKADYGLYNSDAQCTAQIEGKLISVDDDCVVWKNKLSFEGQTGGKHKAFGAGRPAVAKWKKNSIHLGVCLEEAIDGIAELLQQELAGCCFADVNEPLVKIKLKPGGNIKGNIVRQEKDRVIIQLKGGSIRSVPSQEVVKTDKQ